MGSQANPPSSRAMTPPTSWTSPSATPPPANTDSGVEKELVERMALATYCLRRIARIEVGYFDLRLRYQSVPEQINQDGRADPLAFAYHYDCSEDQVFDRLSRYE